MTSPERQLEEELIEKLCGLKYEHRTDIHDRAALEKNFREKFEALNRVTLTDAEFARLLDEITTPVAPQRAQADGKERDREDLRTREEHHYL